MVSFQVPNSHGHAFVPGARRRRAYCSRLQLQTGQQIEDAAVRWMLDLEALTGRQPVDTRHTGASGH